MIWHSKKERPERTAILMTLKYETKPNGFILAVLDPRKFEKDFLWEIFADDFMSWSYYSDFVKQIAGRNKNERGSSFNDNKRNK